MASALHQRTAPLNSAGQRRPSAPYLNTVWPDSASSALSQPTGNSPKPMPPFASSRLGAFALKPQQSRLIKPHQGKQPKAHDPLGRLVLGASLELGGWNLELLRAQRQPRPIKAKNPAIVPNQGISRQTIKKRSPRNSHPPANRTPPLGVGCWVLDVSHFPPIKASARNPPLPLACGKGSSPSFDRPAPPPRNRPSFSVACGLGLMAPSLAGI